MQLRPDAVAVNQVLKKIAILEHCRPFDRDKLCTTRVPPASASLAAPGLPPEEEVSDEELIGPGARQSDDLGTSTGATSADWSPSFEVHAERASDRKSIRVA